MASTLRAIIALTLIAGVLVIAGCNTMEGFGKDVKNTGEAIEKKASD
ncbi:hypothetical protein KBTX_02723 [wastewater metagenome]|uniref:Entericidin EcnA/B family n=2 Tax=unclassified sequences TaxID=12908 RepID=A0A5B8RCL7_9ZZZZ|nr:entericidin A/B family lipoprotein [Arhodomonas aquaeolei]MCS4503842.1 entericidin A/B family lipoprotein [Arhodomonas aquaeolei]QEA06386.1 hypothetical protein KBTEX_02723 [uncultured organism]